MNKWQIAAFVCLAVFVLGVPFNTVIGTGISHSYFARDFTHWTWLRHFGWAVLVYAPALLLAAVCYLKAKRGTA